MDGEGSGTPGADVPKHVRYFGSVFSAAVLLPGFERQLVRLLLLDVSLNLFYF
jgi:hypothetical protein